MRSGAIRRSFTRRSICRGSIFSGDRPTPHSFGALAALTAGWCAHRALADDLFAAPRWRLPAIALTGLVLAVAALTALAKGKLAASALAIASGASFLMLALIWLFEGARLSRAWPRAAMIALAALMTLDLGVGNRPNEFTGLPPQDYDILRAGTDNETIRLLKDKLAEGAREGRRDRVELAGLGFHWPNAGLVHGMDNLLGYNPIRPAFRRGDGGARPCRPAGQRVFAPFFPSYKFVAADLFGLRYLALGAPAETIDKTLAPGDLRLIARTIDGYIYENPRALPRAFVAETAMAADFGELLKTGTWPAFDPLNTVLLENATRAGRPDRRRTGAGDDHRLRQCPRPHLCPRPARRLAGVERHLAGRVDRDARRRGDGHPAGQWRVSRRGAAAGPARGGFRVQAVARIVARLARTIAGPPCVRPNGAA